MILKTARELSELFGKDLRWFGKKAKEGSLKIHGKLNKSRLYNLEEVQEFIDKRNARKWDCKHYSKCLFSVALKNGDSMKCGYCEKYVKTEM